MWRNDGFAFEAAVVVLQRGREQCMVCPQGGCQCAAFPQALCWFQRPVVILNLSRAFASVADEEVTCYDVLHPRITNLEPISPKSARPGVNVFNFLVIWRTQLNLSRAGFCMLRLTPGTAVCYSGSVTSQPLPSVSPTCQSAVAVSPLVQRAQSGARRVSRRRSTTLT